MTDQKQFCTFYLDGLFFGVDVLKVQEIIRHQAMTRVPLAPNEVKGLINLRGDIVTAIDLRRRLRLPDRPADAEPTNVVVRDEERAVALLVDEIGDVLEVDEENFEPTPETLDTAVRELITGVYKINGRLLHVLDTDRAVALDHAAVGSQV